MYPLAVLVSMIVAAVIINPIRKRKNRQNGFCSCGETHIPMSKIVLEMKNEKFQEVKTDA